MVLKLLRSYSLELITALVMIFLLITGLKLARFNLNLQLKAFHSQLKQQDLIDENVSYTRLLIKYINQKDLYQGTLDKDRADKAEMEYNSVFLQNLKNQSGNFTYSRPEKGAIMLINLVRKVTGNPPVSIGGSQDNISLLLSGAYTMENTQNYEQAVKIYQMILSNQLNRDLKGTILLHSGFCYALTENFDEARNAYLYVIREYNGSGISVAAALLLRYMELFLEERQKIISSGTDTLTKGEQLSMLLSHKSALEVLENYQATNKRDKSRLEYVKGVCYDETGKKDKAIQSFVESIKADQTSPEATFANRRLYSIARENHGSRELIKASLELSKKQGDQIVSEIEGLYQASTVIPAETTNSLPAASPAVPETAEATASNTAAGPLQDETTNQTVSVLDTTQMVQALQTAAAAIPDKPSHLTPEYPSAAAKKKPKVLHSKLISQNVILTTIDNEQISGILRTSEYGDYIILDSVMGNIGFKKENVKSITPFVNIR